MKEGSTVLGEPYRMKYTDRYGNLCERLVDRPDFISRYFNDSNTIDAHNHVRQSELGLEKKWPSKDPYFRLATTLVGMCVTDTWKLAYFHKIIDPNRAGFSEEKKTSIQRFAGSLAIQLISSASSLLSEYDVVENVRSIEIEATSSSMTSDLTKQHCSSIDTVDSLRPPLIDANNCIHRLVKLPKSEGGQKKYSLSRKCKMCWEKGVRHDVTYFCYDCGMSSSFCSPDGSKNKNRDCFLEHVRQIKRVLPKRKRE